MTSHANLAPTPEVLDMHGWSPEGNVIPHAWYSTICTKNGKVQMNAIILLAEIVYWYRPRLVRDEHSGLVAGVFRRFAGDLLQKSYQDFYRQFGLSKDQCRDALMFLESLGAVKRVFRTIQTELGRTLPDVMFIQIYPDVIKDLSTPPSENSEGGAGFFRGAGRKIPTHTEITSEITTQTIRESRPASLSGPPLETPPVQAGAAPEMPRKIEPAPPAKALRPVELQSISPRLKTEQPACPAAGPTRPAPENQMERAGEFTPAPATQSTPPVSCGDAPAAGGIMAELEAMAAKIRAAAESDLRPARAVSSESSASPFPANDPVRRLANDYVRLLLAEYDAGREVYGQRRLDLEASRIGLLHAVAENPAKFQKLRDRRLYVRKWLHNERAKRPV